MLLGVSGLHIYITELYEMTQGYLSNNNTAGYENTTYAESVVIQSFNTFDLEINCY